MLGEVISTAGPNHIDCCDSYNFMALVQRKFTIEYSLYFIYPSNGLKYFANKKIFVFDFKIYQMITFK